MWVAAAATTSGPSVAVHGWVAWIIVVAAVLFAVGVIRAFIWPITKAAVQFSEIWSQIADEKTGFVALVADVKDLKGRIEGIESKLEDALAAGRGTGADPRKPSV